jgi:hypothetical protein
MTTHNTLSSEIVRTILDKWKTRATGWQSGFLSDNISLSRTRASFPSPDATIYDFDNELSIFMEFKPPTETKRGILTGLGQAIAYLQHCSVSYLISPDIIESFPMREYLKDLFREKIENKIAVGLVVYSVNNYKNVAIEVDVTTPNIPSTSTREDNPGNYWAAWRDVPPHQVWLLLDEAYKMGDYANRLEKVWQNFFDTYYFPPGNRETIQPTESKIYMWDGINKLLPFEVKKKELRERVQAGQLTVEEAIRKIKQDASSRPEIRDNLYKDYKKNAKNFLTHLGLWDDEAHLTEVGFELHKVGKLHKPTSKYFQDFLAKVTLIEGKHLELINDIEKFTRNKLFQTKNDAIKDLLDYFENNGYIKKNPNRAQTGARKFLQSEFQLWGKLCLANKEGASYFIPEKGFAFNWKEITRIISL